MQHDDYLAFLKHLYAKTAGEWHLGEANQKSVSTGSLQLSRTRRAFDVVRYIERHCASDDDIFRTFTISKLRETITDTKSTLQASRDELQTSGFMDVLEEYYDELLEGLSVDDLPPVELQLLSDIGIVDPKTDLAATLYMLKVRRKRKVNISIHRELSDGLEILDVWIRETEDWTSQSGEVSRPGRKPKKRLRGFRWLGDILEGGVFVLGDIVIATGWTPLPHVPTGGEPPWRALASIRVGVGLVIEGIKSLRDEKSGESGADGRTT